MARGGSQLRETDFQSLHVTTPPSVNGLWKNVPGRGRVKTRDYRDWIAVASREVRMQRPGRVPGAVAIIMTVDRKGGGSDLDNRVKAVFDLIVKQGVIEDDSKVLAFCAAWAPRSTDERTRLAIMRAEDFTVKYRLNADGASGGWFLDAPDGGEA